MVVLSLDIGSQKTGLAISHGVVAGILPSLPSRSLDELAGNLKKTVDEQSVEKIIVGLPLGLNGKETQEGLRIRGVVRKLKKTLDVKFEFVEESYSTVEARRIAGPNRDFDKDSEAARIILEQYLNDVNRHPELDSGS